jgi:hypothetical protein
MVRRTRLRIVALLQPVLTHGMTRFRWSVDRPTAGEAVVARPAAGRSWEHRGQRDVGWQIGGASAAAAHTELGMPDRVLWLRQRRRSSGITPLAQPDKETS